MKKPSNYTANPAVPPQLAPRLAAILQVLNGALTVSDAARALQLSRNHFQTMMHRSLGAMIEALNPKERGRRAKPQEMSDLERRLARLERENTRLRKRVEATDELLAVAGQLLHGQRQPGRRPRRERRSSGNSEVPSSSDSEPEGRHRRLIATVERMYVLGLSRARAAQLAGIDAATLRRWRRQTRLPAAGARSVMPNEVLTKQIDERVRSLHGLIGASALSHSIAGVSRRAAAAIKARTLRAMERERQCSLRQVLISAAGIMRGIDAMYLKSPTGPCYALIAADAAVPYRTSVAIDAHYDAALVAHLLEKDIEANGAPLVLRADRARAHDAPAVRAILDRHQVLLLHGPPRYPRFYGQLERQNREHRAWLEAMSDPAGEPMQALLERMLYSLNHYWPRRMLRWASAAAVWQDRKPISALTRARFREQVIERKARLARTLDVHAKPDDYLERLAIEQTLTQMGYLQQQIGR